MSQNNNQFTEEEKRIRDEIEKKYGKSPEEFYEEREKRVRDAIEHREPDKVPVSLKFTYFPARYTGIPMSAAYYDPVGWRKTFMKTIIDYEPDIFMSSAGMSFGWVMEIMEPTQTGYMLRYYLPMVYGVLAPLNKLPYLDYSFNFLESITATFDSPEWMEMAAKLVQARREMKNSEN